jgi:hypothetical protein
MIAAWATAAAAQEGEFVALHHSDIDWQNRALPRYPAEAAQLGLGRIDCRVRLFIDDAGALDHLDFEACPTVFHAPVEEAVGRSSWHPARVDGRAVGAQFVLIYQFVDDQRGSAPPNLLNQLPNAPAWSEWCRDVRVPLDAFVHLDEVTWRSLPTLDVPGHPAECRVTLYVDPRGNPVHVAVTDAPTDWGYRIATTWCDARIGRMTPSQPVTLVRPCESP